MLKTGKKLLPLAPLLAYFLPTKRSQKKSDKAMAAASLLGRRKQPDQECATPAPHSLNPLPNNKTTLQKTATIRPHFGTNVVPGSAKKTQQHEWEKGSQFEGLRAG